MTDNSKWKNKSYTDEEVALLEPQGYEFKKVQFLEAEKPFWVCVQYIPPKEK